MNGILLPHDFVRESLELHLFFARIMKEHSIFLEAGFVCKDDALARQADAFKMHFTELLREAVVLSNGVVSEIAFRSGEWVTDKTLRAEHITQELSGIPIDSAVTAEEIRINPAMGINRPALEAQVSMLNQKAIDCANNLIQFKTAVLDGMLQCRLYTFNFPLLIIHIRREAAFYVQKLERLQQGMVLDFISEAVEEERFWNRQMGEHAEFISHLLDPSENALIQKADTFADMFKKLEKRELFGLSKAAMGRVMQESITATRELRDFKAAGTDGLLACKIKSIIIPLLADHVLREANHYLRVLNESKRNLQV